MNEVAEEAPRARITGLVYLLYFTCAIAGSSLLSQKLLIYGEMVNVVADLLYVILTLLLYRLLKPVSRSVSLAAAWLSLAGCAVMILGQFHIAHASINPLIFFGPFCILIGLLIARSFFLPRILGFALILAGVAWLVFLIPSLPRLLSTGIQGVGIAAEAALMLWLLVRGVELDRWREQARERS